MPDFEKRSKELAARFDVLRPGLAPDDVMLVTAALNRHADLRDGCLSLLCEIAEDTGTGEKEGAFTSRLDQAATDVLAVLGGLLEGIKEPSADLRALCEVAKSEESKFFDGLKRLNCGTTRDRMVRYQSELEQHTADLRAKWRKMSEDEKSLLDRERLYAGQMRELMKQVYEEAVPTYATMIRTAAEVLNAIPKGAGELYDFLKEKVREAREKSGKDPANADAIMDAVAELVKKSVFEYLDKRRPDLQPGKIIDLGTKATHYVELLGQGVVDRQVQEVKDSLKCGRRVIVTFSDTRREAADFVRKNGYNAAKPYCEESRRELDSFVSAQPSSSDALRDEARQFADRVQRPWQQFLEQMRTQHESFVGEFDGIFVEQVSELTLNQLTDRDQLTELTESITAMDLDEKLRDLDANLVDLHGDLERAFGSLTVFVELPLKSQAMIQEKVREFERQVREPLSAEMKEQLRKMDAARTTKSKSLIEQVIKDVQDLVTDALREAGAPRSLG